MGMGALRASLISDKLFEIGEYVTDIVSLCIIYRVE